MYNHLFNPLLLGSTNLSNRICFLGHRTNLAKRGRLTDSQIAYYARRAKGKCGLIIIGEFSIHPADQPWESMIETYHQDALEDFRRFTEAIHKHDTKVFAQLNHHGFQSSGAITRKTVWGPSAISDIVFNETAKPMEPEDFKILIDTFSKSARIIQKGGFDGIEIDMGPESLLRQFLSPLSNFRDDEYGGDLENRMQLPIQILSAVREETDSDFTIGVRLCVDEKFWGAITPEESQHYVAQFTEQELTDFINVSVGTYYNLHLFMASMHTPLGFTTDAAANVKKNTDVPVLVSHQIGSPRMADEILEKGQAQPFEPFDRFAQLTESRGKAINDLLVEFEGLRRKNVLELQRMNLSAEDYQKTGMHPEFGVVALGELLATWAVHDLDHIAQIARTMAAQYAGEVGPWKAYLRIIGG